MIAPVVAGVAPASGTNSPRSAPAGPTTASSSGSFADVIATTQAPAAGVCSCGAPVPAPEVEPPLASRLQAPSVVMPPIAAQGDGPAIAAAATSPASEVEPAAPSTPCTHGHEGSTGWPMSQASAAHGVLPVNAPTIDHVGRARFGALTRRR